MDDNTLAYIDQASFLGLRALGRGPVIQSVWVYDHPVDLDGLRRFQRNLGKGLFGRRIERSALPFGRHHWVAETTRSDLDLAEGECPRSEISTWADDCLRAPIDPEHGPGWRLAVQPLAGGGAAVSLAVSHSICDGHGLVLSVIEAVNGVERDLRYPPPNARTRRDALTADARQMAGAVPEIGKAVVSAVRVARAERNDLSSSFKTAGDIPTGDDQPMITPSVVMYVDIDEWDGCARRLGGSSNSLFAGVAARLGQLLGRVDGEGRVNLSWPVSERTEGDHRANALVAATMKADPEQVTADLGVVRGDMRQALAESAETSAKMTGPLPLTPLTPRLLLRRLEAMVLAVDSPIACSNLGDLDPAFSRPDGTDAEFVSVRALEPAITSRALNRIGGQLLLAGCRAHGRVGLVASAWTVGKTNSKDALRKVVSRALADFGLTGSAESPG